MSLKPVTFYMVECDEPECGRTTGDTSDFAAWADKSQALDDWQYGDGVVLDDGRTLCEEHAEVSPCA